MSGVLGTVAIYALMLGCVLLTLRQKMPVAPAPTLAVFDIAPASALPEPLPEADEPPKPVERLEERPTTPTPKPAEPAIIPLPAPTITPPVTVRSAEPRPSEAETAAPRAEPAPPAPRVASSGPDSWEGRVLAQLERNRRYPRLAMARRQQGVPYIRFVMNRDGVVLSSHLERSSGFADLDREAVALAKRASPLPKPPEDRPGETIELVVPVEFFLR